MPNRLKAGPDEWSTFSVSFHGAGALNGLARRRHRALTPPHAPATEARAVRQRLDHKNVTAIDPDLMHAKISNDELAFLEVGLYEWLLAQ